MLTWDEYNKLCDLIDMDWKRWNKRRAKNVEIVADRALEHLGWITSKDFTGQSPKDIRIAFTIPDAGADEFSTGIPKSMTIYELIDGMCWNESTKEKKFGKKLISEKLDYMGSTNHTVTLCNDCPFCKKHYEFTIKMDYDDFIDALWKYKYGKKIQDAFPNLTPDEREQIKTGICNDCWENM
jgi:hypothetical protein